MSRKILYALIVVLAVGLLSMFFLSATEPSEDATRATITGNAIQNSERALEEGTPVDQSSSRFIFEGFGPGKSHEGTFTDWEANLYYENGNIVGADGIIQANSVSTGIGGLDDHLKKEDFFDTSNHPEIIFTSNTIEDGVMTGDLTFLGTTKRISFPVTVTESLSADFVLDTKQFGELNSKANSEVRIAFVMNS